MADEREWAWGGNVATRERPDGTTLMLQVTERHHLLGWSAHVVARRAGLEGGFGPFEELVTNLAVTLLTSRETGVPLRDIALPSEWFEKALALVESRLACAGIKT